MAKATDKELDALHGTLAKIMLSALQVNERAEYLMVTYAEELPAEVYNFLQGLKASNPSLFTSVAKFLKDNEITAVIEESEDMTDLQRRLQNKSRKQIGNVVALHTED